jgi:hypothetical protein
MFRIETTNLAAAIERCRELHPTVRVIAFGDYTVTGSRPGTDYTVKCYRDEQGFKTVDCSCKTRDGIACKHGVAALALHLYMAAALSAAARQAIKHARRR